MSKNSLGPWGEQVAGRHLEAQGYRIVDRNWRHASGELDLVARDGDALVFVEVKARASGAFGSPEEAVTAEKQRRLQRAAWAYLEAHDVLEADWRIDVIAIERRDGQVARLDHYVNAVEYDPLS